ncbi:MAG: recombinase family protein [Defluviitaleaceae bacterium]|nr:recombinase family protein [Defluviitaleaceae bacterium]
MIKRVACLYRVSTKNQLINDDIPMQIKACANFIKKQRTWKLEKEYIEKGVSGFHKSAAERDALVQLKKDAAAGRFDVLLVFMFDRLGRREDETPFIVHWLVNQGVEVWSVNEGQQCFDSHTDKLLNYIRYWQSGGESEHNSMRVAEKHKQLVMDGKFRGGVSPYGYRLENSGEYNKRGHERKKLAIYEPEAMIVRRIYQMSSDVNMGSYKVAKILNGENIQTRHKKKWTVPTIVRMLRNPVYKGDYVAGKTRRKRVDDLIIVPEDIWEQVNANIDRRDTRTNTIDKSGFLLQNIAYCGYCKAKMHPRICRAKRRLKGTNEVAVYSSKYYVCPKNARQGDCSGRIQYGLKKIEAAVLDEIHLNNPIKTRPAAYKSNQEKEQFWKLKRIEQKITSLQKEAARLENEVLKCLMGESVFTEEQLLQTMNENAKFLSELEKEKDSIVARAAVAADRMDGIAEMQKELISMIVERVYIFRETLDIELKFNPYDIGDLRKS